MRYAALMVLGVVISLASARAAESDDLLLDARIEVVMDRLRWLPAYPKMIEAEERLKVLEKDDSESPELYREHVEERLRNAKMEDDTLALRYQAPHPKRVAMKAKIDFLEQELQRAGGKA